MHAARLSTYPLVREEIRSIIMARDALTGQAPMDVSAVYNCKGKGKGKGKDKDKEKDPAANPVSEMICYYCRQKGHRKRDCRTFEKDKDKNGVNAVEQALGLTPGAAVAPSVTPSRVSMIELDNGILAVSFDVRSTERVTVDSGAAVSVCPIGYAPEVLMSNHSTCATLRTACGAQIERARQKMVEYENGDGGLVKVNFEVADVTRQLVSVGELQKNEKTVVMGPHGSFVTRGQVMKRLAAIWFWSVPMALVGGV